MSQINIPNGSIRWQGGGAGAAPVFEFDDVGNPNSRSDPKSLLAGCALNSRYWQQDGVAVASSGSGILWIKTAQPTPTTATGTWTAAL